MSKMLCRFRSSKTFGQVTKIYNKKNTGDYVEDEGGVLFEIKLYLNRDGLPSCIGRFNSRVPVEIMLIQTDLGVEGCSIDEIVGTVMVVHMEMNDRFVEGILNVYTAVYKTALMGILNPLPRSLSRTIICGSETGAWRTVLTLDICRHRAVIRRIM
jgi:hypothetical protein